MSIRESQRCEAQTLAGERCKLRTARGRMCWIHLKKHKGLRVKRSTIAGLGLHATKRIPKKKVIAKYTGERLTKAQVDARYKARGQRGDYVLCAGSKPTSQCVDARRSNSGVARFANDPRGSGKRANAKLTKAFSLKSKRAIRPGTEILASYGAAYWKQN